MGASPVCEHCGKKFKVFAKRSKCTHCMITVCRRCYDPHLSARHPNVSGVNRNSESWIVDDDDIHFQSPMNASGSGSGNGSDSSFSGVTGSGVKRGKAKKESEASSTDLLADLEDVGVMEVEENDDDDDEDEDDLLLGEFSRRASMEEEESQFREFTQIQGAVEKWTRKEIEIKKQQRRSKHQSSIYATKPVPNFGSTRESQQRELFSAAYGVFVTLIVWAIFVVGMAIYGRLRIVVERTVSTT